MGPIRFAPQVLAKPWGGGALLRGLGVSVPDSTGEVWLISDVPGRSSRITSGPGAGGTLADLLATDRARVLGRAARPGRFPLLVKLLEVQGSLSLQVHPDAAQARRNGDGEAGKFEAWSVLAASKGARVVLGLDRPLSREEVRRLIAEGRLEERLNSFEPAAGDAYVIAPGTVHAASGGLLLLEVQETADVTYRLYDWGTVGLDGEPRELHVDKGLAVADLRPRSPSRPPPPVARSERGARVRSIVGEGPFRYELLELEVGTRFSLADERPWAVVGLAGRLGLGDVELGPGDAALWPAAAGKGELLARDRATCAVATPDMPGAQEPRKSLA